MKDIVKRKRQTAHHAEAQQKRRNAFDDYLTQLGMLADPPPQKISGATLARA